MTPQPRCELVRGRTVELSPLVDATSGAPPRRATQVTLADLGAALHVRFRCAAPDPWATITERDGDLWTEEVVELFIAPGAATPLSYFEIELNPLGTLFDARVSSPHGERRGMQVEREWQAAGIATRIERDPAGFWSAELTLPWKAVGSGDERFWRANFFRIDRPRVTNLPLTPEFSAWSPTLRSPADFHRPERFGFLERIE